jgi:proteasome lid subunit RPN8/RPN11
MVASNDFKNLSAETQEKIAELALSRFPKELCGVLRSGEFIELENIAEEPETSFRFDPTQYIHYRDCDAIIHSHTKKQKRAYRLDLRTPSRADRIGQIESNKPWGIIATDGISVMEPIWLPRTPNNTYLGRPFIWFINDCYTLVQDYYLFEFGIRLIDHALEFDYMQGHRLQDKVFEKYISAAGFVERDVVGELRKGELLLLNHAGVEQSHLGIYTGDTVLHQDILSTVVSTDRVYHKISRVLAHPAVKLEAV